MSRMSLVAVIAALAFLAASVPAQAQYYGGGGSYYGGGSGYSFYYSSGSSSYRPSSYYYSGYTPANSRYQYVGGPATTGYGDRGYGTYQDNHFQTNGYDRYAARWAQSEQGGGTHMSGYESHGGEWSQHHGYHYTPGAGWHGGTHVGDH